jgi:7-carboxy-7-deazaguanine synthase
MLKGKIAEIFESFQGEGLYLGERQLFVRFFGCNLKCKFCDTKLNRYNEYEPDELLRELKQYKQGYHSVAFTGGEPLMQKDFLKEAASLTRGHGFKNYLETNGTLTWELEEVIDFIDIIAMDLKLSSSTEMADFWDVHRRFLKVASKRELFLKVVICHSTQEKDLYEALSLIKEVHREAVLVLQPNAAEDISTLRNKLESFRDISGSQGVTACVIPQVHKMMGAR